MPHLHKSLITTFLIILNATFFIPSQSQTPEQKRINDKLILALNSHNNKYLKDLVSEKIYLNLINKKANFKKRFPNAKWFLDPDGDNQNGKHSFNILVTGKREINNLSFILKSQQKIILETYKNKIINYNIIDNYSVMKSLESPLNIKIIIPEYVLTGTRYDIDIILEEPIAENFLAGGLIQTSNKNINNLKNPSINLSPLSSGGLFKSVQAPQKPGKQTISAIMIHTKGIIAITKSVNILSKREEISL